MSDLKLTGWGAALILVCGLAGCHSAKDSEEARAAGHTTEIAKGSEHNATMEKQMKKTTLRRLIVSKENNRSELLDLKEVVGPPDKPTELVLVMKDSDEVIHLSPDKPYQEAQDYTVDLRYALENRTWRNQRTNSPPLVIGGAQYKIVAITESNVVFSAQSNNKKTTKTFNPATEPTR